MGDGPDLGCAPAVTFVADGGRFVVRTRMHSGESRRSRLGDSTMLNLRERKRERRGEEQRPTESACSNIEPRGLVSLAVRPLCDSRVLLLRERSPAKNADRDFSRIERGFRKETGRS